LTAAGRAPSTAEKKHIVAPIVSAIRKCSISFFLNPYLYKKNMDAPGTLVIKSLIKKLHEQDATVTQRELIVSFECSGEQEPFRDVLKQLVGINYRAVLSNQSFYKLPAAIDDARIIKLATEIETEFTKYDGDMFTEGYSDNGTSKVCFILPQSNKLEIAEIINYPNKKAKKK
jgi:hypothetical protein